VLISAASNRMNQFTGKERDAETGLDYFGARYYSGAQGRFASPDPLLNSGRPQTPQSWNRYAYALNNPLAFVDPTGLFDWGAEAGWELTDNQLDFIKTYGPSGMRKWAKKALKFRKTFREALDDAKEAAEESGQRDAINAVDAYGTENDGNGVLVDVRKRDLAGGPAELMPNANGTMTVSFNSNLSGDKMIMSLSHEGAHALDLNNWMLAGKPVGGPLDMNHYFIESHAWRVNSYMAEELGMSCYPQGNSRYQVWNKKWDAADRETFRSRGVSNILDEKYSSGGILGTDTYSKELLPH
jgi:RHS repeat-associated protein